MVTENNKLLLVKTLNSKNHPHISNCQGQMAIYNVGGKMSVITTYEAVDQATLDQVAAKITALQDKVALVPLEATNKSLGGIVIPDSATKEGSGKGVVVAVGPGRQNTNGELIAMNIQAGQVVYYSKYAGTEVNIEGTKVLIVKADDLLAIENN